MTRSAFTYKLKLIYIPFLLISIGFVILYCTIARLFLMKDGLYTLDEMLVTLWLPFCLPWVPFVIWLRPRLRILAFGDRSFFYQFIAVGITAGTTMAALSCMASLAGTTTHLAMASHISTARQSKYYTIDSCYVDKASRQFSTQIKKGGKYGEDLDLSMYVVCPLRDSRDQWDQPPGDAWIAAAYHKRISSRLKDSVAINKYSQFLAESDKAFYERSFQPLAFIERIGEHDEDLPFYEEAVASSGLSNDVKPMIFKPHSEPLATRQTRKLSLMIGLYLLGAFVWCIMTYIPKLRVLELRHLLQGHPFRDDSARGFLALFVPSGKYIVTPILADLDIMIFLFMVIKGSGVVSFHAGDLVRWGANYLPLLLEGQWWRLVTCVFMHGGLIHLVNNVAALVLIGRSLEPLIGSRKFILAYLNAGIAGSAASAMWHPSAVSVGASGAIFGLFGMAITLWFCKYPRMRNVAGFEISFISAFIIINLALGALIPEIDNAAHLGGLIAGIIFGLILVAARNSDPLNYESSDSVI